MTLNYVIKKISKKLGLVLATIIISCTLLQGCGSNRQLIDTSWNFKKAIILIGDEKIEVDVESWKDFDTDTTIQIKDKNGAVYLTDIKNVLLMNE